MFSIKAMVFFIIGYLIAFLITFLINSKTGKITKLQNNMKSIPPLKKIAILIVIISGISILLAFVKGMTPLGFGEQAYILDGILLGGVISLFLNFDYQK